MPHDLVKQLHSALSQAAELFRRNSYLATTTPAGSAELKATASWIDGLIDDVEMEVAI